jgi:hypothetical protein
MAGGGGANAALRTPPVAPAATKPETKEYGTG